MLFLQKKMLQGQSWKSSHRNLISVKGSGKFQSQEKDLSQVYQFARAIVTKYHKLRGFNNKNVLSYNKCGRSW